jgi:hypothetical protein
MFSGTIYCVSTYGRVEFLQTGQLRSDVGGSRHRDDDVAVVAVPDLLLHLGQQQSAVGLVSQHLDLVEELHPGQNVGVVFIGSQEHCWSVPAEIRLLATSEEVDCLLDCASGASASGEHHVFVSGSAETAEHAVPGVVHELGREL